MKYAAAVCALLALVCISIGWAARTCCPACQRPFVTDEPAVVVQPAVTTETVVVTQPAATAEPVRGTRRVVAVPVRAVVAVPRGAVVVRAGPVRLFGRVRTNIAERRTVRALNQGVRRTARATVYSY